MTAKKKFNFKAPLEVFAKSIVQPMMYLSVAGILLIVGIILTNKTICAVVPVLGSGPFQLVGAVVYQSLMFIINNLSILFCVGIAGAMAKKNKGHASLIALMSFFLFLQANNIVLNATGSLAEASGMLGLTGTGQSTVMGIQVLDTGVFGGIILGCITGAVFNKYSNKQFPIALSMFSGVRFPFLIMIIISWIMGAGFCIVWPPVQGAISSVAGIIKESGNIGLFIYGMLNKLLVPTGLHHLIYTPFQFSDVGGTLTLGDQVIAGAYPIRVAEMAMTGQPFSDSTYFNSYTFNNLWPYIGIGLAFIFTAYKGNKDKTKAVIIPLIITAVLSCVTEPWTSSLSLPLPCSLSFTRFFPASSWFCSRSSPCPLRLQAASSTSWFPTWSSVSTRPTGRLCWCLESSTPLCTSSSSPSLLRSSTSTRLVARKSPSLLSPLPRARPPRLSR